MSLPDEQGPETAAPRVLVDADACPVKDEAVRVAGRHGLLTIFVANSGMRPSRDPLVRNVVVPQGADAADDWIVAEARPSDIAITADIGLAARLIPLGVAVLRPTGEAFTADSIGMALAMRDLNRHLRETGESRGFNASFGAKQRSMFLAKLDEVVVRRIRERAK